METHVSLQEAIILRDVGYKGPCNTWYDLAKNIQQSNATAIVDNSHSNIVAAPLKSDAFDYLIEIEKERQKFQLLPACCYCGKKRPDDGFVLIVMGGPYGSAKCWNITTQSGCKENKKDYKPGKD